MSIIDTLRGRNAPKDTKKDDFDAKFADLEARIAALGEENKRIAGERDALLTNLRPTPPAPPPAPPEEDEWDLKGLPDPVTEHEKFQTELGKRLDSRLRDREERLRDDIATRLQGDAAQRAELDARIAAVDSQWDKTYGNRGWSADLVQFASTQVVKEAQRRGKDAEKYVFTTTDSYLKDVADYIESRFPGGGEPREPGEGDSTREARHPAEETPLRTAGVLGGSDGKPNSGRAETPKAGSVVEDLTAIQRETGLW